MKANHNRSTIRHIFSAFIVILMLVSSFFSASGINSAGAQAPTITPPPPDNQELADLLVNDITSNGKKIPEGYTLVVDHGNAQNGWMIISYYFLTNENDAVGESLGIGFVQDENWKAITNANPLYNNRLQDIPNALLDDDLKQYFTSPVDDITMASTYTGHKLPWQGGISHKVTTGVGGHSSPVEYWAYDFSMSNGTEVWASFSGQVAYVTQSFGPGACDASLANSGNRVVVNNDDGTASLYLHLQKDGARVSVGQRVNQGDLIGLSGNSGYVCGSGGGYHLHFQVQTQGASWWTQSQQVIFDPNGEPPVNSSPVSGNYRSGGGNSCSGPSLNNPSDGYVSSGQTIAFSWSALSGCTFNGYTFRVNDSSNMDLAT